MQLSEDDWAYFSKIADRIGNKLWRGWHGRLPGLEKADCTQSVLEEMIRAAGNFDPSRSSDLRGHCISTGHRRAYDRLRSQDVVPHPTRAFVAGMFALQERVTAAEGRTVTLAEAGASLGIDPELTHKAMQRVTVHDAASLDVERSGDGDSTGTVGETIAATEHDAYAETPASDALAGYCSAYEREVIELRIDGLSFIEIGELLGATPVEARRVYSRALAILGEVLTGSGGF